MTEIPNDIKKLSFEDAMSELEEIVDNLESGNIDLDKSIISGHYIFSSEAFIEIKSEVYKKVINLDLILKNKVKDSIYRYMKAFNLDL